MTSNARCLTRQLAVLAIATNWLTGCHARKGRDFGRVGRAQLFHLRQECCCRRRADAGDRRQDVVTPGDLLLIPDEDQQFGIENLGLTPAKLDPLVDLIPDQIERRLRPSAFQGEALLDHLPSCNGHFRDPCHRIGRRFSRSRLHNGREPARTSASISSVLARRPRTSAKRRDRYGLMIATRIPASCRQA